MIEEADNSRCGDHTHAPFDVIMTFTVRALRDNSQKFAATSNADHTVSGSLDFTAYWVNSNKTACSKPA